MATKVLVELPGGVEYAVRVGSGLIEGLGASMAAVPALAPRRRVLVVSDDNVAPLYLPQAKASLKAAGYQVADVVVPAGEASKTLDVAHEIWDAMASLKLDRTCVVVALGGGVVGDLAGFVASSYMRGVALVQVPTTLLAMVDSSVGGKTAVNLSAGKNLVGSFWQPSYVCADQGSLESLDDREWACGLAEIAKSALVGSDDFFFWLLEHVDDLAARDYDAAAEAVARSVVFKADVVARDVMETNGVRACLNYGHTLGHALERALGYGAVSHGGAVAEGMRFAAFLADRRGMVSGDFASAQNELLDALGLPRMGELPPIESLVEAMAHDKKARQGEARFVLLSDVALWELVAVGDDELSSALHAYAER